MAEQPPDADAATREQALLTRQRGIETAVRQWKMDLVAEGHSSGSGDNEQKIRALKARRTVLYEQSRSVGQAIRDVRRGHSYSSHGIPDLWWRWIGAHRP